MPKPDFAFTMEQLAEGLSVCVTKEHRFGTDAFLLSDFANVRRRDTACDLGTGCGIIPLLWFRDRSEAPQVAYGVDIQPLAIRQLCYTVEQAQLQERVLPVQEPPGPQALPAYSCWAWEPLLQFLQQQHHNLFHLLLLKI